MSDKLLPVAGEKVISDDGKFIVGKDNWLFINNDTNGVLGQVTGKKRYSDAVLDSWASLLVRRRKRLEETGIPYFHVVAPSKECVYADKLPDGLTLSEDRPIRQLLAELERVGEGNLLVYPYEQLHAHRSHRETYPRGDSHWNWYGGYIAYVAVMDALGMLPLDSSAITFVDVETQSDLAAKLGQPDIVTRARIINNQSERTYNNGISKIGNLQIYENTNRRLPTALIFRDSFTTQLADYLGQHFCRMVLAWQPNIDWTLVEKEKPDYVLGIQAERFMTKLPDDINGPTIDQNVALKMAAAEG